MNYNFQISDIKDRRITTGGANQKEILQRESHMRNRIRNKWGGEHQTITELSKPRGFGNGYTRSIDDVKRCHHCKSDQHLIRDCEQAKGNQNTQGTRPTFQKSRVNQMQVTSTDEVSEETETKVVMKCGVNLKPNHQEIMPEQIVLKTNSQERGEQCFEEI